MNDPLSPQSNDRDRELAVVRNLEAIVNAVGQTQGLLLKVISNLQDLSLGRTPDIAIADLTDSWEKAAATLREAADILSQKEDLPGTDDVSR